MAYIEQRGDKFRTVVRIPGGGKKTRTFDRKDEAELWGAKMEARKDTGELNAGSDVRNHELFEEFLDVKAGGTDTGKWNRYRLMKMMTDPIGELKVQQTGTAHINEWIARRLTQVSKGTAKRELALLSSAFTYAVKVRKWISENPCKGCNRPPDNPPRHRPLLGEDEIAALRIATGYDSDLDLITKSARVGAMFLLALETGMRSGEILRLRPEDYRRDARTVRVSALETGGRKTSKSGTTIRSAGRFVPLSETAIEILDRLVASMPKDQKPIPPGMMMPPYIVGMSDGVRDALWRDRVSSAGIVDLHFHDLKHEAATRLSKFLDVLELSHAIGTKDVRLLRDTYYVIDASATAARLPKTLRDVKR